MNQYVWTLAVEYPEEAKYPTERERELFGELDPSWEPDGWKPDCDYLARTNGVREFFWPKVERIYRSRSAAVNRANLLEGYGAKVRLLRSLPIVFEERPFQHKHTGGAA